MEHCQSKVGGACAREATWVQAVRAGDRAAGRLLYSTFWCDEHAQRVIERRKTNWITAAIMTQLVEEDTPLEVESSSRSDTAVIEPERARDAEHAKERS